MLRKKVILSAIQEDKLKNILDSKVSKDMMKTENEKKSFVFLQDFYRENGEFPTVDQLEEEIGINLSDVEINFDFSHYAEKLKSEYMLEKFNDKVDYEIRHGLEEKDLSIVKDRLQDYLMDLESVISEGAVEVDIRKNAGQRFEEYNERKDHTEKCLGITTPWNLLDRATLGMEDGELWVIVARQGVGKTWFSILFADEIWKSGKKVLFVTMEDPINKIETRWDAIHAKVPYEGLRGGTLSKNEEEMYMHSLHQMSMLPPMKIVDRGRIKTPYDIEAFLKDSDINYDVIIIDGLFFMTMTNRMRDFYLEQAFVIRRMTEISESNKIPILVTTHFQRKGETEEEIANSQDISRCANIILRLTKTRDDFLKREMFLSLIKNRDGPEMHFRCKFDLDMMDFQQLGETDEKGEYIGNF